MSWPVESTTKGEKLVRLQLRKWLNHHLEMPVSMILKVCVYVHVMHACVCVVCLFSGLHVLMCSILLFIVKKSVLAPDEYRRARHVITEDNRVIVSIQSIQVGDYKKFGQLMKQSHTSLKYVASILMY